MRGILGKSGGPGVQNMSFGGIWQGLKREGKLRGGHDIAAGHCDRRIKKAKRSRPIRKPKERRPAEVSAEGKRLWCGGDARGQQKNEAVDQG